MSSSKPVYDKPRTGEVAGSITSVRLPNIGPTSLIYIKAHQDNVNPVYIGPYNPAQDVTVANGSTDETTGFQLLPGETSPPLPIQGLHMLAIIGTAATDDITYLAFN